MSVDPYACVAALTVLPLCTAVTASEEVEQEQTPSTETAPPSHAWSKVAFGKSGAAAQPQFDFGDHMVLPTSDIGQPLTHGPAVVLNESGVYVDGTKVVTLRQGQLEIPAEEASAAISSAIADLQEGQAQPSRLAIFADRGLHFRLLIVVILATDAAVPGFLLVVRNNDGEVLGLEFDRPRLDPNEKLDLDPDEGAWALDVGASSSVRVGVRTPDAGEGSGWIERKSLVEGNTTDQRGFQDLARAFAKQFPSTPNNRRALIAFDPETSMQRVATVLSTVNGPDCQTSPADAARCFFPQRTLFADAVHILGGQADTTACVGLDKDGIRCSIKSNLNAIRTCYPNRGSDSAEGTLGVRFRIDGRTGKVMTASIHNDTLGVESTRSCLLEKVRGITFPTEPGRGAVVV